MSNPATTTEIDPDTICGDCGLSDESVVGIDALDILLCDECVQERIGDADYRATLDSLRGAI